eukprot:14417882-Alexandrium_andersonii.AAC.1
MATTRTCAAGWPPPTPTSPCFKVKCSGPAGSRTSVGAEELLAGRPEEAGRALEVGADRALVDSSERCLTPTCHAPSGLAATAWAAPSTPTGA